MAAVTFPYMGASHIAFEMLLRDLGNEVVPPARPNRETLSKGVRLAPEFACLPLKILLGTYVDALERGADTIVTTGGVGPCRAGYYAALHEKILRREGYRPRMIVFEPLSKGLGRFLRCIAELNRARLSIRAIVSLALRTWEFIKAFDALEACLHRMRPREASRGLAESAYTMALEQVASCRTTREIRQAALDGVRMIESIPVREVVPLRVGIVGEIYVLLEPAANLGIEKMLGELGVEVVRSMFLSGWVQHNAVHEGGGLDIKSAARRYLPEMVGGHGQDSVGHTVLYSMRGVDGVVQLAPFTCIPEIVAKSVLERVSADLDIPVISFFLDEQTADAGIRTRLEAFVDLLFRRRKAKEVQSL